MQSPYCATSAVADPNIKPRAKVKGTTPEHQEASCKVIAPSTAAAFDKSS